MLPKPAQALLWLSQAEPQDAYRTQVTAPLERLLVEGDVHGNLDPDLLLRAYLHWAGPGQRSFPDPHGGNPQPPLLGRPQNRLGHASPSASCRTGKRPTCWRGNWPIPISTTRPSMR